MCTIYTKKVSRDGFFGAANLLERIQRTQMYKKMNSDLRNKCSENFKTILRLTKLDLFSGYHEKCFLPHINFHMNQSKIKLKTLDNLQIEKSSDIIVPVTPHVKSS